MTQAAEFVIIGGGIIGSSIAYHLAKRGAHDVIVLEQGALGSGSTAKAAGGIRAQFGSEISIRMSLYSQNIYRHFAEEFGISADYEEIGYLFLLTTAAELEAFRRNVALQNSLGVPSTLLTLEEVQAMVPALRVEDLSGAAYCPTDGKAGPSEALQGFVRRARELGVQFREYSPVTAIEVRHGRVQTVRTPGESYAASTVVNAAGPWAAQVGKLVGVTVPVRPLKRHIWITEPFEAIPGPTPQVIDFHSGFYFRKEHENVMWSGGDMLERWDYNTEVEWNQLQEAVEKAIQRVPVLAQARVLRGWAGLREVTPDHLPIIGPVPEVAGFICAAGFSGHGFMHAPAAGRLVAEMLLEGRTFLDITPFRYERFTESAHPTQRELSIGSRVEDE